MLTFAKPPRRVVAAAASTLALSAALGLAGQSSAQAQLPPAQTMDATGCASNVCMYLAGNAGGSIVVQAWARNNDFSGYFTLTGPNSLQRNSPNQRWIGHKGNYWSTGLNGAPGGTYCITGNPGQGTACLRLS